MVFYRQRAQRLIICLGDIHLLMRYIQRYSCNIRKQRRYQQDKEQIWFMFISHLVKLGANYEIYAYHLNLKIIHTQHSSFSVRSKIYLNFSWIIATTYKLQSKFQVYMRFKSCQEQFNHQILYQQQQMMVIPNTVLTPTKLSSRKQKLQKLRIIIVRRLVYLRGTDLFLQILLIFCERNKAENFSIEIIEDGPKFATLKILIAKHQLQNKIILHGGLPNDKRIEIVKQCDIFLSTALTQFFGFALMEATHLGLHCISTNFGGVNQILPPDRLHIVDVAPNSIVSEAVVAVEQYKDYKFGPSVVSHSIHNCFERIIEVYREVSISESQSQKIAILKDIFIKGSLVGLLLVLVFAIIYLIDWILKIQIFFRRKLKLQ